MRKISEDHVQVIKIMLMSQHKRVDEVALRLGVTRQTIWGVCKKYGINPYRPIIQTCAYCEKEFETTRALVRKGRGLYCNEDCYCEHRNEIGDYQPWRHEHRLARKAIEEWLGFKLPEGLVVHHEDGNQRNSKLSNLWVFRSHSEHLKYHHARRNGEAALPYQELWELPEKIVEWVDKRA